MQDGRQRQVDAELLLHAGKHPDGDQRVAAEVEEVVVDAHLRHAEHERPDRSDLRLHRITRRILHIELDALAVKRRRVGAGVFGVDLLLQKGDVDGRHQHLRSAVVREHPVENGKALLGRERLRHVECHAV